MDFSIEQVVQVVQNMYAPGNTANIKEADIFLKSFQKSSAAWAIIDQILGQPNLPESVYTFSAQTLKLKLCYDYAEIAGTDMNLFKQNLLGLCLRFADTASVMRQLA